MPHRKPVEYLEPDGSSPFARWFARLDAVAGAKVTTALYRMEQGNLSNVKPVGQGVAEYRIDFGPGYRIYIGQDGAGIDTGRRGQEIEHSPESDSDEYTVTGALFAFGGKAALIK